MRELMELAPASQYGGRAPAPAAARTYPSPQFEILGQFLRLAGLTSRQIGDALFISEKTVSVHVTNLLRKLGVPGRTKALRSGAGSAENGYLIEVNALAVPPADRRRYPPAPSPASLMMVSVAPCGSLMTARRPGGASAGGTATCPPSSVACAAAASQSVTAK